MSRLSVVGIRWFSGRAHAVGFAGFPGEEAYVEVMRSRRTKEFSGLLDNGSVSRSECSAVILPGLAVPLL